MATWDSYNLPAIWQMLQGENVCTGADRVLAWEGLAASVREQHRRLIKAGEDLAEVWPPEKNTSAVAFLAQITGLATSMEDTLKRAEDTRAGLRGVMEAIGQAQSTVRTLAEGRADVSTDWIPRFIDHAEDEYDERAQQAMQAAEKAIADHSTQITAPELFVMSPGIDDSTPFLNEEDDGTSSGGSGTGSVRATPLPVTVPHDPVLPETGGGSAVGNGGQSSGSDPSLGIGPGLSGVTPPPLGVNPAPVPSPAPVTPGVPVVLPPAGPGIGGGFLPGTVIGGGGLGVVPGGPGGPFGRAGGVGGRQAVPMRRGLPSGAVIGEGGITTGRGVAATGRGGAAVGRGAAATGRGVAGQSPLGGHGGRRGGRTDGSDPVIGGDADEQWATLEGVAPVIMPDTTPVRHDPGPGIIGLDR